MGPENVTEGTETLIGGLKTVTMGPAPVAPFSVPEITTVFPRSSGPIYVVSY